MAFMMPLMKNHYEIYNTRSPLSDHEQYLYSASSNMNGIVGRRRTGSNENRKQNVANGTVVLNGIVLMNANGRTKHNNNNNNKPKIILSKNITNKGQTKFTSMIEKNEKCSPVKKLQSLPIHNSTQSMNNTRSFPHVRRTVRNPITNRVYSYSVSIPEYVAEEDEEELAALELEAEQHSSLDQMMIFSTSAPAGTGPIDNGIIDIVDEDDFIRRTGTRLPTTISKQSKQLLLSSSSSNSATTNSIQNNNLSPFSQHSTSLTNETSMNGNVQTLESSTSKNSGSPKYTHCTSSNSREYMELLQKFILHLKMLKLKRIFHSKSKDNHGRNRTSTLNGTKNL